MSYASSPLSQREMQIFNEQYRQALALGNAEFYKSHLLQAVEVARNELSLPFGGLKPLANEFGWQPLRITASNNRALVGEEELYLITGLISNSNKCLNVEGQLISFDKQASSNTFTRDIPILMFPEHWYGVEGKLTGYTTPQKLGANISPFCDGTGGTAILCGTRFAKSYLLGPSIRPIQIQPTQYQPQQPQQQQSQVQVITQQGMI